MKTQDLPIKICSESANVFGLNKAQAELYKYLLKCQKEQTECNILDVAKIYYSRGTNYSIWDGTKHKPCTAEEYAENLYYYHIKMGHKPLTTVQTWLKSNIGSFVMRGLMVAIPKFNPNTIGK